MSANLCQEQEQSDKLDILHLTLRLRCYTREVVGECLVHPVNEFLGCRDERATEAGVAKFLGAELDRIAI